MEKEVITSLYQEYKKCLGSMQKYFETCYNEIDYFYPSVTNWLNKIIKIDKSKVNEFMRINELTPINEFYDKYFYSIIKGDSYLFEFVDLGYNDLKNFIKTNYSECLSAQGFKGLSELFRKRKECLDLVYLQEYSGKNRSRETLKKEGQFISSKEIYYLNPLIDDLWYTHGYNEMTRDALIGTRVINIRGTNGSGKTTMVKKLIERLNKDDEGVWDEFTTEEITTYHKVYTRKIQVWHKHKFIVMGIYNEKQTGGVDNYDTPWQVMYALLLFCKKYKGYTILFEGVRISTDYKYWWRIFSMLISVGVRVDVVGLIPSDVQWAVNNVIERRKGKGLWELRHPEDIANNNYDILRGLLLFLSEGFNPFVLQVDKINSIEDSFKLLCSFINLEVM